MITVKRIECEPAAKQGAVQSWRLTATISNGSTQVFGNPWMSEAGAKKMLLRRAKQFGLKVTGNIAE